MLDNFNAKIKTVAGKGCTMIYRWGDQTYHISYMENDKVMEITDARLKKKEEGIVVLHPKFMNNYYSQLV